VKPATGRTVAGFMFILPWLAGLGVLTIGPFIIAGWVSFTRYSIIAPAEYIGVGNYVRLVQDRLFWQALKVTLSYAVIAIPGGIALGLLLALILNMRLPARGGFRSLFFLPSILLASVPVAVLWVWMYNPQYGIINYLLSLVGIQGPKWLESSTWVLPSIIIMSLWGCGQTMIILLAGLQGIPEQFYEAAQIDGAKWHHRFWHITVPLLSPVIFFNLIIGLIGSFMVFTQAYIMTAGGPYYATLFYVYYLYLNAFKYLRMGYASALGWVMVAIVFSLTFLMFKTAKRWVFYQS